MVKIKKIEVIGGIYPRILYFSRSELNKEDTEKIFKKTRKLILRPDVYETFAQENKNKIVRFNKIEIDFTTFQSEGDYSTFECTSDNAEDDNDFTSSNKSNINRYPQYDTFNTWKITYKGKYQYEHIPVK